MRVLPELGGLVGRVLGFLIGTALKAIVKVKNIKNDIICDCTM